MKPQETREQFIDMRARGLSYRTIADKLNISRSTCSEWEKDLKEIISAAKREKIETLIEKYSITKEQRISDLGEMLLDIRGGISQIDMEKEPLDKLMKAYAQTTKALDKEMKGLHGAESVEPTTEGILQAYSELYTECKRGELTDGEIKSRIAILNNMLHIKGVADNEELFS